MLYMGRVSTEADCRKNSTTLGKPSATSTAVAGRHASARRGGIIMHFQITKTLEDPRRVISYANETLSWCEISLPHGRAIVALDGRDDDALLADINKCG